MCTRDGFTLIEVIATLLLVGIIAVFGGMFLADGIKGYLFARNNIETSQKTTIARERIRRELAIISSVSTAGINTITFKNSLGQRTLGLDGSNVRLTLGTGSLSSGDVLLGDVNGFTVTYTSYDGSTWTISDNATQLAEISVTMTVPFDDPDLSPRNITVTVNPRNTGKNIAPEPN
jgi:prepilin-type N-terminal cleavage/methylation domain-containing protein